MIKRLIRLFVLTTKFVNEWLNIISLLVLNSIIFRYERRPLQMPLRNTHNNRLAAPIRTINMEVKVFVPAEASCQRYWKIKVEYLCRMRSSYGSIL